MQQGGSQYGVPPSDMTQFTPSGAGGCAQMLGISGPEQLQQQQLAEAASPISSRPPPPHAMPRPPNFEELVPTGMPGGFADDDALAAAAGEEAERGGAPGNRWPRQETLALLKIRSEMDTAFRDATLKGPLWEDVSRKLAGLGYTRSAKKCKEKFENVHKYYKRTKEGRAGRQDGKSYRFFTQLEALHSSSAASSTPNPTSGVPAMTTGPSTTTPIGTSPLAGSSARLQPSPISAAPPLITTTTRVVPDLIPAGASAGISSSAAAAAGTSFSSNTSSSSSSESDDEETEEGASTREGRKRKHRGSRGSSRKMMAFFKGLMKQVMERQDAMQKQFLETIEKREQDRMIREEAWRRQEMVRLSREHELMAQDRAMAASRDAAVISFLQKISGQTIQLPPATVIPAAPPPQHSPIPAPPPATQHKPLPLSQEPPQPQQQQPPPPQQQHHPHHTEITRHLASSSSDLVPVPEPQETAHGTGGFEPGMTSSSRWPKSEVHALIKLRSGLESRYQEAGPKGPLWEEISSEMQKLGYNRTSKRCKEKWENINKYFKKVKESNKKRPDDAKTCPYFHQLEALYRKKLLGSGSGGGSSSGSGGTLVTLRQQEQENNPNLQEISEVLPIVAPQAAPPPPRQQPQPETEVKSGNNNRNGENTEATGGSTDIQQTSNGDVLPSFFEEGTSSGSTMKKPEDIMKELMEQQQQTAVMDNYDKLDEPDSNDIDQDDDDDDEDDDEDRKMQYKIQFQRQNVGNGSEGDAANASAKAAATSAGSFLAMVQ